MNNSREQVFIEKNRINCKSKPLLEMPLFSKPPLLELPSVRFGSSQPLLERPIVLSGFSKPLLELPNAHFSSSKPLLKLPSACFSSSKPLLDLPNAHFESSKPLLELPNERSGSSKPRLELPNVRSSSSNPHLEMPTAHSSSSKSLEYEEPEKDVIDINIEEDFDLPDRSYGDYFCKICDSHMNSSAMWEAHIIGKRHIKNAEKEDTDSKYDLHVESYIKDELKDLKVPVLGLSFIQEIRKREPGFPAMYNCVLCLSSIATVPLVIEHVTGTKHQLNFMRENEPDEHKLIESTQLKKGLIEPVISEVAAKLEAKYGRGTIKVKMEKPQPADTYKRKWGEKNDEKGEIRKSFKDKKFFEVESHRRDSFDKEIRSNHRKRSPSPISMFRPPHIYGSERSPRDGSERSSRERISPERDSYRNSYSRPSECYDSSWPTDSLTRSIPDHRKPNPYGSSFQPEDRSFPGLDNILNFPSYRVPIGTKPAEPPKDFMNNFRDFMSQILNLPPELFLKIVLLKLDTIEFKGINELLLLTKIIQKASNIQSNNLPPDFQALFQRMASTNQNESSMFNQSPHGSSAQARNINSDLRFNPQSQMEFDVRGTVNELLYRRKEFESSAINEQAQSSNFNNVNTVTAAPHVYRNPPSAPFHPSSFTSSFNDSPISHAPNYWPDVNTSSVRQDRPNFSPSSTKVLASDSNYEQHRPQQPIIHNSPFVKPINIPGQTLTEKGDHQRKPFDYSSESKWPRVNPRNVDIFKRY